MDVDSTWKLRVAMVMPDHVHLLVVLGGRLSLGKSISRLKAKTMSELNASRVDLDWERDFFDRLLRPDEDRLALFLYIFLNPYRAKLCALPERWPCFWCREEDWKWFKNHLEDERPVPEWLR
jgi:REP element-mobilizing transposase RayT